MAQRRPQGRGQQLLDPDDIRLLTQIGFLAAAGADVQRAKVIFGALSCVRPERSFAHVGMATALLNAGRAGDAVLYLEKLRLPAGEEADMVQVFLGIALQMDRRNSEATRVLRRIASSADGKPPSEAALLAQKLLGDVPAAPFGQTALATLSGH